MHRSFVFAIPAVFVLACAAQQDIVKSVPDVAQCVETAVDSFITGVPDIAGLITHCGATVADIEKIIADLETKQDAGVASANPERAKNIQAWKAALATYKASHPNDK